MSDFTSNSVSFPVHPTDKRPLPELVAEHWDFPLAFHEEDGQRYYAVQDWIAGVGQAAESRKFWNAMKRRFHKAGIDLSTLCRQFPYLTRNGKVYQVDFAEASVLYQITQRMDANTGLRNEVLKFLAKAGVILDDIRIDPEKAIDAAVEAYRRQGRNEAWIQTRLMSKIQRIYFTAAFKKSLRENPGKQQYAIITNELRLGLWKRSTAMLRLQMGLKEKDNVRDHQTALALSYEMLAENISAYKLDQRSNLEFSESKHIVRSTAEE